MRRRLLVGLVAIAGALALTAPAGAQFTENALGEITASGDTVTIRSSQKTGPLWFGLRVFTVPAGTMTGHNVLKTSKTSLAYDGKGHAGGKVLCVSDFQGTGSPGGGMFGKPASDGTALFDPFISMVGGFVGTATGCKDGSGSADITITMNTTGPIVQAFYGAFFGHSAADWRGDVGQLTGNPAWWNLWGNFTELGFGSTG